MATRRVSRAVACYVSSGFALICVKDGKPKSRYFDRRVEALTHINVEQGALRERLTFVAPDLKGRAILTAAFPERALLTLGSFIHGLVMSMFYRWVVVINSLSAFSCCRSMEFAGGTGRDRAGSAREISGSIFGEGATSRRQAKKFPFDP
ncbi:MAG: hypothetical protein K2Y27_07465 [Xanthobacteraceae bacterium]|nr:hypothetical protein [Xanthobacteraceae bacterium]